MPRSASPRTSYTFDPAKGKKLLAEAGFTPQKPLSFKVMISTSGSGQMLPLPMNEALQENLKQACGVDVQVDAVEWQVLLNASRATPDAPALNGAMALNVSSPSSDVGMMFRYFAAANSSPTGSNFQQWKDDKFEAALTTLAEATDDADDPGELQGGARAAGRQPAVALHRPRPEPARLQQERAGLRSRRSPGSST